MTKRQAQRRQTQRRVRISKNKTSKKAHVIGTGVTSCVVKPRYQCEGESTKQYNTRAKDEVGKVMTHRDAKYESRYEKDIRELDPHGIFTLGSSRVCMPKGSPSDIREELISQGCNTRRLMRDMNKPVSMVISKYGGTSVDDIDPERVASSFKRFIPTQPSGKSISAIMVTEAIRLLYGVQRIQKTGKTHFDLHSGNVLMNPHTAELRMIDFINANTNEFMVSNDDIVSLIIRYASLLNVRNYHQFPTELPIIAVLATKDSSPDILHPVILLEPTLPTDIREAIEDGAEGRSSGALRRALRRLPPASPYLSVGDVLLPDRIPEGDTLFNERCRCIVGMWETTRHIPSAANRTRHVLRRCIHTMDSFAVGNVLYEYIIKVLGGFGKGLDMDSLDVLLRVVNSLRNPSQSSRIRVSTALDSLRSLAKSLPDDPRGAAVQRVHTTVSDAI